MFESNSRLHNAPRPTYIQQVLRRWAAVCPQREDPALLRAVERDVHQPLSCACWFVLYPHYRAERSLTRFVAQPTRSVQLSSYREYCGRFLTRPQ
jgi:hypothetical protein